MSASLSTPVSAVGFYNTGSVAVHGISALAFCSTIVAPGLQHIANHVRSLSLSFGESRPSPSGLKIVAKAFESLPNLEELIILGIAHPDKDGWILKNVPFTLRRFVTDLSPFSVDVLRFLAQQPGIFEFGTTIQYLGPTKTRVHINTQDRIAFPPKILPNLTTLDCPGEFLLSLLLSAPPTRALTHLRLYLDTVTPSVEVDILSALSMFSPNLQTLSLHREAADNRKIRRARDPALWLTMAEVIIRFAERRQWTNLRYLELHDGIFDPVSMVLARSSVTGLIMNVQASITDLQESIFTHFKHLETLVWAPSPPLEMLSGSNYLTRKALTPEHIALTFMSFCSSLKRFVLLDPGIDEQGTTGQYISFGKHGGGEVYEEGVLRAAEVEDGWRSE